MLPKETSLWDPREPEWDRIELLARPSMPASSEILSSEQIAAVSAFVRVTHGGADQDDALTYCGLDGASP